MLVMVMFKGKNWFSMNTPLNYTCFNATYVRREENFLGLFMMGFPQLEALDDQCERMQTRVVKVCLRAWERKAGVSELLGYYKQRNFTIILVTCGGEVLDVAVG
jgi:hypothetical protein